ncbi:MAG: hypothetical protein QNI84_16855 [Henriciella sp.]|nr:hypothetical protein [Henriciella sp.]
MFIGHYSAAFAARAAKPSIPLWQLFVAVQLVDFAWAGLVLAGVEKLRITKGFMEASILDLHHMPYTHSLVAVIVWAIAAGALYGVLRKGGGKVAAGLIIGGAVFSHWLLDLIVHGPDLALYFGGPKVGLGLWNSMLWTQVVEIGGLLIGAAIYIAHTKPKGRWGVIAPIALIAFMLMLQIYNHLPLDHPPAVPFFAIQALFGYTLLAVLAWLVDRTRQPA